MHVSVQVTVTVGWSVGQPVCTVTVGWSVGQPVCMCVCSLDLAQVMLTVGQFVGTSGGAFAPLNGYRSENNAKKNL